MMIRTLCRINDISIENDSDESETETPGQRTYNTVLNGKRRMLDAVLDIGDIVKLTSDGHTYLNDDDGEPIIAVYCGNNKFEYRDEIKSSTYLAKKCINLYAYDRNGQKKEVVSINGNAYWTFEGKKLTDLDSDEENTTEEN